MDTQLISLVCILFVLLPDNASADENLELFRDSGLIWLEHWDDRVMFQHMFMKNLNTNTEPVNIAATPQFVHLFTHIDMHHGERTFVMSDVQSQKIVGLTFGEGEFSELYWFWDIYEGTSTKVNGIAIDWVSDVVYWTDAAYDVILATPPFTYPNVAEVIVGYLFWTDASPRKPCVMRSGLGGKGITAVVRLVDRRPLSLFIDYDDNRLYWLYERDGDASDTGIMSCDLYGNHAKTHETTNKKYFDISLFYGQLIAMDESGVDIYKKNSNSLLARIERGSRPLALQFMDTTRQDYKPNECLTSRCPGVCTMSNRTEDCFCSNLVSHALDRRTYRGYCGGKTFEGLLLPKGDGIFTIKTNFVEYKGTSARAKTALTKVFHSDAAIWALTSDVHGGKIFYFDARVKAIKSIETRHKAEPEIISLAVEEVRGLAFDSATRNLYWTDTKLGHIMVTNEMGEYPHVLYRNLDNPYAIVVHPIKRLLFWSENATGLLERTYLNGAGRITLVPSKSDYITGISIDFNTDKLYLCNHNTLYEMEFDGTGLRLLYQRDNHTFMGLSVMHDYLVVVDNSLRKESGLHVFDKNVKANENLRSVGKVTYKYLLLGNWFSIWYHHVSNQPDNLSLCNAKKATCDQLCLPGYREVTCVCEKGYVAKGSQCIVETFKPPLVIADQRMRQMFLFHSRRYAAVPAQGLQQPYHVAVDRVTNMVYWSDLDTGTITRCQLNGHDQEVVIYSPSVYILSMAIDSGSRLLYYLSRDIYDFQMGKLMVYHLDTNVTNELVGNLDDPQGLALNPENGYAFLTEQGNIWRVNMNGTDLIDLVILNPGYSSHVTSEVNTGYSSHVVTEGDYVYFVYSMKSIDLQYKTRFVRCSLDGYNKTVLHQFPDNSVSSLAIGRGYLYWGNMTSRSIYRTDLSGNFSPSGWGPQGMFVKPTGIAVMPIGPGTETMCKNMEDECTGGICLPSPGGPKCRRDVYLETMAIDEDHSIAAPCQIPKIQHGAVVGNQPGRYVSHGYKARVECFPAHKISRDQPLICLNGMWSSKIPQCVLEYSICGTPSRGYKIYTESDKYFVYPQATKLDVIVIGGGGGGYDVTNEVVLASRKAGDGGDSRFGSYLLAFGGKGGTDVSGGDGGMGQYTGGSGEIGLVNQNCTTGGTAAMSQSGSPGSSYRLFAGSGGYSAECKITSDSNKTYAGPGGTESKGDQAGYFGGGAGRNKGGTGGGGGWSRLGKILTEKEVVEVEVGAAGDPSYGSPAPGAVIVMWGGFHIDDHVKDFDFINGGCFPRI